MKVKKRHFILAGLLALGSAFYVYFFGGPFRFADYPLSESAIQHFHSAAPAEATWMSSPADAADEYLHWWCHPSDRPQRSRLDISVSYLSSEEAIVTVINRHTQDDSVSATCDRLTLRRVMTGWIPIRHQAARQGRGRFGWTTQPTT